jgi:dihydrofolate reductase
MISIIVAMSENRVIGNNNSLIWKLPNDLKRFKSITSGSAVVMGRKTYESIGRPLPNRRNIIITRNEDYEVEGCVMCNSLPEALMLTNNDCFVIGGGEIYRQALPIANKLYLTIVHNTFDGDTTFPELDENWTEVLSESNNKDYKNEYDYTFVNYERYKF